MLRRLSLSLVQTALRLRERRRWRLRSQLRGLVRGIKLRPRFELLEDRALLAVVTWDGGAGTFEWGDALNWSTDLEPGPTDDVVIGDLPGAPTILITQSNLDSGAVDVQSILAFERLEVGSLVSMSVALTSSYHQGLDFAGPSTFIGGAVQSVYGDSVWNEPDSLQASWTNHGTLAVIAKASGSRLGSLLNLGSLSVSDSFLGGAVIDTSITHRGDQFLISETSFSGVGTLRNESEMRTFGNVPLGPSVGFSNPGVLIVNSGHFSVQQQTSSVISNTLVEGEWTIVTGAQLSFAADPEIRTIGAAAVVELAGSFPSLESLEVVNGTLILRREFTTNGPLENRGNVTIGASYSLTVLGDLTQTSGSLRLGDGVGTQGTLETDTFFLDGGVFLGSGSVIGTVVSRGGEIAPGIGAGDLGTMEFGGWDHEANGSLRMEVDATDLLRSDRLVVGGLARIGGGISVEMSRGYVDASETLFLIDYASGGFLGGFLDFPKFEGEDVLEFVENAPQTDPFQVGVKGTVLVVRNAADSGPMSLRDRIHTANAQASMDRILFGIPSIGPHTIQPLSELPSIVTPVKLKANSQRGYAGTPVIELDGSLAGATTGLTVRTPGSANSVIQGLAINRFVGSGVLISETADIEVLGNYIGTDLSGAVDLGNGGSGVHVVGSLAIQIGNSSGGGNLISGNGDAGVVLYDYGFLGTTLNAVRGNKIGVNASGTNALPNQVGVRIYNSTGNRIGGADDSAGNLISGNLSDGILIGGVLSSGNAIQGNVIGLDANGENPLGNAQAGIRIEEGGGNRIGGDTTFARNVISGNDIGILMTGGTVRDNLVQGNYLGTNVVGDTAVGNGRGIVLENGASENIIGIGGDGDEDATEGNVISGNTGTFGIGIEIADGHNNVVAGNQIGLSASGLVAIGNVDGVLVHMGSTNNRIGTNSDGSSDDMERNVISGNLERGIRIEGIETQGTAVAGNWIGLSVSGDQPLGNGGVGIEVDGAYDVRIGVDDNGFGREVERNIISGNGSNAIELHGRPTLIESIADVISMEMGTIEGYSITGTLQQSDLVNPSSPEVGNWPNNHLLPGGGGENYGWVMTTTIEVSESGLYSFALGGDDGSKLWIDNSVVVDSDQVFGFLVDYGQVFLDAGTYALEWRGFDHTGFGGWELSVSPGDNTSAVSPSNGWKLLGADVPHPQIKLGSQMEVTAYYPDPESSEVLVAGNWIGTGASGLDLHPNQGLGIMAESISGLTVGGDGKAMRNVLVSNLGGMTLSHVIGSEVINNLVGLDKNREGNVGNAGTGIEVSNQSRQVLVHGNEIANQAVGIGIIDSQGIRVTGNILGVEGDERTIRENQTGILLVRDNQSQIGTDGDGVNDAAEGNTLTASTQSHIWLQTSEGTTIAGNELGVNPSGEAIVGNPLRPIGINVEDSVSIRIGTDSSDDAFNALERNTIVGASKGIDVTNSWNAKISGNWIGVAPQGMGSDYRNSYGIWVDGGSDGTRIGSDLNGVHDELERNVVSNSIFDGVVISGGATRWSVIQGNYIGTDPSGSVAVGNQDAGVRLIEPQSTSVRSNLISGNGLHGVSLTNTRNAWISGNMIGTKSNGVEGLPNLGSGVYVTGLSSGTTVGGNVPDERNVISFNEGHGVEFQSNTGSENFVIGNYIGLDRDGLLDAGNAGIGVLVSGSNRISVGSAPEIDTAFGSSSYGNLIAGNDLGGIAFLGQGSAGGIVEGNWIGLDRTGLAAIPSNGFGVLVGFLSGMGEAAGAHSITIGGMLETARNVISGHAGPGIWLAGIYTTENQIYGNWIGTNSLGLAAVPNGVGVLVSNGAVSNQIGGVGAARNVISGNSGAGIRIQGLSTEGNWVHGNWIGLDATGLRGLGNGGFGIEIVQDAAYNVLTKNVIAGNALGGVSLSGGGSNSLYSNWIGTDASGLKGVEQAFLGGDGIGVWLSDTQGNAIGSGSWIDANVISGNSGDGVRITGSSSGNTVSGNAIGTDLSGQATVSNGGHGISMAGALVTSNTVGGMNEEAGNKIFFNLKSGLRLEGATSSTEADNTFLHNVYRGNVELAVDVGAAGATMNDGSDLDGLVDAPLITAAYLSTLGKLVVEGFSRPGKTIQVYQSAPVNNGRGQGTRRVASLVEGTVDDLDPRPGAYSVEGIGSDAQAVSFRFEIELGTQTSLEFGDLVTAITVGSTSEFGNVITLGDVVSNRAPEIALDETEVTVTAGDEWSLAGSFVDFDSTTWTAVVDYGDGSPVEVLALTPQRTFALRHVYTNPVHSDGPLIARLTITDNGGSSSTRSVRVHVENPAPLVTVSDITFEKSVNEGGLLTLRGSFGDAGSTESHTVEVAWGDQTTTITTLPAGEFHFEIAHRYLDDDALNTAQDPYSIEVTVRDAGGGESKTFGVLVTEVFNVRPSDLVLASDLPVTVEGVPQISEGSEFRLAGAFWDPGVRDGHVLTIDWGDGSPMERIELPPELGQTPLRSFEIGHRFLNNGLSPDGTVEITVEVADDDEPLQSIRSTQRLRVQNVAPTIESLLVIADSILENETVEISIAWADPGVLDAHTLIVDWGDGSTPVRIQPDRGVTRLDGVTHQYLNEFLEGGPYRVQVRIADRDMAVGTYVEAEVPVMVHNVAPIPSQPHLEVRTLSGDWESSEPGSRILEGTEVRVTGSFTDQGSLDNHQVRVQWAEGEVTWATVDSILRTYSAVYRYRDDYASGTFEDLETVEITVIDDHGDEGAALTSVNVENVPPQVRFVPLPESDADWIYLQAIVVDPGEEVFQYQWSASALGAGDPMFGIPSVPGADAVFALNRRDFGDASIRLQLDVFDDDSGSGTYTSAFLFGASGNVDDRLDIDDSNFAEGIDNLTVLTFGGSDIVNATMLSPGKHIVVDGGDGADYLFGGGGDDTLILRSGDDNANVLPEGLSGITVNEGGNDRYVLSPNSTLTVKDGSGLNTLDFSRANLGSDREPVGVTFSLNRIPLNAFAMQDVGLETGAAGGHFVNAQGVFAELVGSRYGDHLTGKSGANVFAGDGEDRLFVPDGMVSGSFRGGADADVFTIDGVTVGAIDLEGDSGADVFEIRNAVLTGIDFGGGADADVFTIQNATLSGIDFGGGADADTFQLIGVSTLTGVDFSGDSGTDAFVLLGTVHGTIDFGGGADADTLTIGSTGSAGAIDFEGDSGADVLTLSGVVLGGIDFGGGADADVFVLGSGGSVGTIDFDGDSGADEFIVRGAVLGGIDFGGGADADSLLIASTGVVGSIDFDGDSGADVFVIEGQVLGTIDFGGGADADVFVLTGVVQLGIDFGGGADADTLLVTGTVGGGIDFEGDSGADVFELRGVVSGTIDFGGGADADTLLIVGTAGGGIDFSGDSGADALELRGSVVGGIDFGGGADADSLLVVGSVGGGIDFEGDSGADVFELRGIVVGGIDFGGGADADALLITGVVQQGIDFSGDSGADVLEVRSQVLGAIDFSGGADGDTLAIRGGGSVGAIDFEGDSGADALEVRGIVLGGIDFGGGADADTLVLSGVVVDGIDFAGDAGDDRLFTTGVLSWIYFQGGEGSDTFRNDASDVEWIEVDGFEWSGSLRGGDPELDGNDLFVNFGSGISELYMTGAGGDDVFYSVGNNLGELWFQGDSGADVFIVTGANIGLIDFQGGADADSLSLSGSNFGGIDFQGDEDPESGGEDILVNSATGRLNRSGMPTGSIVFQGMSGADAFRNDGGSWKEIVFIGGDDNDGMQNNAEAIEVLVFDGGDGDDVLQNQGDGLQRIVQLGGLGSDLLLNNGNNVSNVTVLGGVGDDALINTGADVQKVWFVEESGANRLVNTGARLTDVVFQGGSDGDTLTNAGAGARRITLYGNAGADRMINGIGGGKSQELGLFDFGQIPEPGTYGSWEWPALRSYFMAWPAIPEAIPDDSDDVFANRGAGTVDVQFHGGVGQDYFQNSGGALSKVYVNGGLGNDTVLNTAGGNDLMEFQFYGEDGEDRFQNDGAHSGWYYFDGGEGNDAIYQNGDAFEGITFHAGDGANVLVNWGNAGGTLRMVGGRGADRLQNQGDAFGLVQFIGGGGENALQNNGSFGDRIEFFGGENEDTLLNSGNRIRQIVFHGNQGNDALVNAGSDIGGLVPAGTPQTGVRFVGGDGIDVMRTEGIGLSLLEYLGGDGSDTLIYNTTSGGAIQFQGGAANDSLVFRGGASRIDAKFDAGDDRLVFSGVMVNGVSGLPNVTLDGGDGSDSYAFAGAPKAIVSVTERTELGEDLSRDLLDFSSYSVGAIVLDLASPVRQPLGPGFEIEIAGDSLQGIEDVIGTQFGDTVYGNDRPNVLHGAVYLDQGSTSAFPTERETQWVYLDFDTETEPGEYRYSEADRAAVLAGLHRSYYGVDAQGVPREYSDPDRWFNVRFAMHESELAGVNEYVSIRFNDTPPDGFPGGLASEVDPGNVHLGGRAWVQVHGLLGGTALAPQLSVSEVGLAGDFLTQPSDGQLTYGQRNPDNTVENFLALSIKISAHELGHLLGLRHYDAFGPIGSGVHTPPGTDAFNPAYSGLAEAFETFSHLISSPASVGSDRKNDVGQLFFGEREAIKLAYAMSDAETTTVVEAVGPKGELTTAQTIDWVTIAVPNTLSQGVNRNQNLYAEVLSVMGAIELDGLTGKSEDDHYRFEGRRGDVITLEVNSRAVRRFTDPEGMDTLVPDGFIDSRVKVLDSNGDEVPYYRSTAFNDDEFESTDSLLIDLILPTDGVYHVVVDTFARERLPSDPTSLEGVDPISAKLFLDQVEDTDIGEYKLFAYRFARENARDARNSLFGRGGIDVLRGTSEEVYGIQVDVQELPQRLSVIESESVQFVVPFSDVGGTSWTAQLDYEGDGTIDEVIEDFTPSTGLQIERMYPDDGSYRLFWVLSNDDESTVSGNVEVEIRNASPTAEVEVVGTREGERIQVLVDGSDSVGDRLAGLRYVVSTDRMERDRATYANSSESSIWDTTFSDNASVVFYVRVMDKDGGFTDYDAPWDVENVAPVAVLSNSESAIEGGEVEVSLSDVVDPSEVDRGLGFRYSFGLDRSELALSYAQAASEASQRLIVWDNSQDGAPVPVFGRVFDKDGGYSDYVGQVNVANANPSVQQVEVSTPVLLGQTVTLSVAASDPAGDFDALTYHFNIYYGSNLISSGSQSSSEVQFTPNNEGVYAYQVRVTDEDGGESDWMEGEIRVESLFSLSVEMPSDGYVGVPGQAREYRLKASSSGGSDGYRYEIDWRDGSSVEVIEQGGSEQVVSHRFIRPGMFSPSIQAFDSLGRMASMVIGPLSFGLFEQQGGRLAVGVSDGGGEDDEVVVQASTTAGLFTIAVNGAAFQNLPGSDSVTLYGGGGVDRLVVQGNANSETVYVSESSITYNLMRSFGIDSFEMREVRTREGNDVIIVEAGAAVKVLGGSGNDLVRASGGASQSTEWRITGANSGEAVLAGEVQSRVQFAEVESITGSDDAVDRFVFQSQGSLTGSLRGGGGVFQDELNVAAIHGAIHLGTKKATKLSGVFQEIESFVGASGGLTGPNGAVEWTVTGNRQGALSYSEGGGVITQQFTGFGTLQGGSGADTFRLHSQGRVTSILGGAGTDTLVGPDISTTWSLTELGGGSLLSSVGFKQMENLVGGAAYDRFQVRPAGRIAGNIDPGSGENVLDYGLFTTSVQVDFSLATPKGNNVGSFADRFAVVLGGSASDLLTGSLSQSMVLVGNGGSDTLVGGNAADILIGGLGSDTLRGMGGQDIVIGGRVLFDSTPEGLLSLWREWSRPDVGYTARIEHLMGAATGGRNGNFYLRNKLSASDPLPGTLPEDSAVDTLFGGQDQDWFVSSLTDIDSDRAASEGELKTVPGPLNW